jgi:Ca2+-binding RTX toxin-like protein
MSQAQSDYYRIETYRFADGTTLSHDQIVAMIPPAIATVAVSGTAGNDTMVSTAANESIDAGSGNDVIDFGASNNGFDVVNGGAGTDTVRALADNIVIGLISFSGIEAVNPNGFTNFTLLGSDQGNNFAFGSFPVSAAAFLVDGGPGDDTITFSSRTGIVRGGTGDDVLSTGSGDANLIGGSGSDVLQGGAGNDTYQFAPGDGQDQITDTGGVDRIEIAAGVLPSEVVLRQQEGNLVLGPACRPTFCSRRPPASNSCGSPRRVTSTGPSCKSSILSTSTRPRSTPSRS